MKTSHPHTKNNTKAEEVLQTSDFRLQTSDFRLRTSDFGLEGVECRKQRRLRRSRYGTPGPNFLWHVEGWDKLAPFGAFIHEAVDGFSRRILWLTVNSTNKDPSIISSHYFNAVLQLEGVPKRLSCVR